MDARKPTKAMEKVGVERIIVKDNSSRSRMSQQGKNGLAMAKKTRKMVDSTCLVAQTLDNRNGQRYRLHKKMGFVKTRWTQ